MAPELIAGQYNAKADVWSTGAIAFMLLSSSMPFFGKSRYEIMKRIMKGNFKFLAKRWQGVSKYGKGVVRHLMEYDPYQRPSADRALKLVRKWRKKLEMENANAYNSNQAPSQPSPRTYEPRTSTLSSEEDIEMMDRIQASVQSFSQYNTLKKLALMVIAHKSTASEIGWLRNNFSQFDLLQNGEISMEEFTAALSELYDYSEEEIQALFNGMDIDGTGSVHYTEFLAATIESHGTIDESRIADAFDRIDCDDSGYITIQNCEFILLVCVLAAKHNLGAPLTLFSLSSARIFGPRCSGIIPSSYHRRCGYFPGPKVSVWYRQTV